MYYGDSDVYTVHHLIMVSILSMFIYFDPCFREVFVTLIAVEVDLVH